MAERLRDGKPLLVSIVNADTSSTKVVPMRQADQQQGGAS
jgi:hypothetical protein